MTVPDDLNIGDFVSWDADALNINHSTMRFADGVYEGTLHGFTAFSGCNEHNGYYFLIVNGDLGQFKKSKP